MILRVIDRDIGRDTYEAVRSEIDIDHAHPLGLIMHSGVEVDGKMRIAQIWESQEYADRFDEEILTPGLEAVGAPVDAEITVFPLRHLVTP